MNIAYLPLDSRPCNARFPVQLGRLAGVNVVVPDMEILDYFDKPSRHEDIEAFVQEAARGADALVVAVEQLCYGSILASREMDITRETALAHLEVLTRIKRERPELPITAFAIIMRTAGSNYSDADIRVNALITEYSQACYHNDAAAIARLARRIPKKALENYLAVRARNHAVNLRCAQMLQEGVLDCLLFSQEDCQPQGLHKQEQAELLSGLHNLPPRAHAAMHNGTDEAGCLCVARAINQRGTPFRLAVRYPRARGGMFTALYEDRAFDENVNSQCAFLAIERAVEPPYDGILYIDTPDDGKQLDCAFASALDDDIYAERIAGEIYLDILSGVPTGYLDVRTANGGLGGVLAAFAQKTTPLALRAYAAWNTASNSLGTALAQMLLSGDNVQANARFTLERLLDDYAYEGVVRTEINKALRKCGENVLFLADKAVCELEISRAMAAFVRESPVFASTQPFAFRCSLPWPRTFEISIDVLSE